MIRGKNRYQRLCIWLSQSFTEIGFINHIGHNNCVCWVELFFGDYEEISLGYTQTKEKMD